MCEYWKAFSFQSPEIIKETLKETSSKTRGCDGEIRLRNLAFMGLQHFTGSGLLHEV